MASWAGQTWLKALCFLFELAYNQKFASMGHTPLLCLSYNQGSSTLYLYPELPHQQMLEDMQGLLQAAEEKRQASLAELSSKHQKVNLLRLLGFWRVRIFIFFLSHIYNICSLSFLSSPSQNIASLEAQIADSVSDRNKATETISSLQVKLVKFYAASVTSGSSSVMNTVMLMAFLFSLGLHALSRPSLISSLYSCAIKDKKKFLHHHQSYLQINVLPILQATLIKLVLNVHVRYFRDW